MQFQGTILSGGCDIDLLTIDLRDEMPGHDLDLLKYFLTDTFPILYVIRRFKIKKIEIDNMIGITHNRCNKFGGTSNFGIKNDLVVFVTFEEFVQFECLRLV